MPTALFINGVFKETLAEIETAQHDNPGMPCYLQPYSSRRIKLLADAAPSPESPITLYLSLSNPLNEVAYIGKIVGWQDKEKLLSDPIREATANQHIKSFQPSETNIYATSGDGKLCVNLISVVDLKRLPRSFPVSHLIKASDGLPLKKRTRSGGWSPVQELIQRFEENAQLPMKEQVEAAFQEAVARSLTGDAQARRQRLASAPKIPTKCYVVTASYARNADVIAEALIRANGICEHCRRPAPFHRASDDRPFLEVHHRVMLSAGGEDTEENAIAVCPNCHRELHFGKTDHLALTTS